MTEEIQRSDLEKASVFVVEDDGLIAYSLSADLRKAGFEVAGVAASGEDALQQIELVRPQLILMDIHLRGQMDGIELAERVRAQFETPVIYITARSDADTLKRAKTTEPFAYLAKPVGASALYASIGTALRKHRAQGDLPQLRNYLSTPAVALHTPRSKGFSPMHETIQAAESAADITQNLLAFSSKQSSKPQLVDWNEVIRDHDRFCRRLLGPGVSFSTRLEPQLGLVHADPTALTEVLLNLVTNSRDSMPNGGSIMLRTTNVSGGSRIHPNSSPADLVSFAVHDSGAGMDAGGAERVFEPLFSKEKAERSQLGLSIVHGLVDELGGFIDVESKIGSGTIFTVCFPRASPAAGVGPAVPQPLSGKHLLVVDDDPAVRRVLVSILAAEGHWVVEAENGREALELVNKHDGPFDLLITDVVMPGLSGPALSSAVRVSQPGIKTLFVTGFPGDLLRGSNASDEKCVLSKPFSRTGLLRKVNALLQSAPYRSTTTL